MHTKRHTPMNETADMATLFRYVARLMGRAGNRGPKGRHGSHAQDRVLAIVVERGPMTQKALLELLDVRSASLSELLTKLERAGLVLRERNEADRRGFIVSATDAAKAHAAGLEQQDAGADDSLFACLDQAEQDALRAILLKLAEAARDEPGACRRGNRGGRGGGRGRGYNGEPGRGPGRGKGGRRR